MSKTMSCVMRLARGALAASAVAAGLVACGGDGGGDSSAPAASALTLSGTAATGALMAGATVEFKCATGGGSTTTGSDGTFSATLPNAAWPCVVRATPASGSVLHSIALGTGATAVANLTLASELVVAALAGQAPDAFFQAYSSAQASAITAASVSTAQQQVIGTLKAAGVDFSAAGDLIAGVYSAVYDASQDALAALFTSSGTTLQTLSTAFVSVSDASAASLPPELLLQPAAASCSALRSASYRLLTPTTSGVLADQLTKVSLNAGTLTLTRADGSTATWAANGACRFTEAHGSYSADIVVSQAGVVVARYTSDGVNYRNYVGFPEQVHTVAELAGTWNGLGLAYVSASLYAGQAGQTTFDASGRMTAVSACQNNSTWAIDVCTSLSDTLLNLIPPLALDAGGGFDATNSDGSVAGRLFAYKAGGGAMLLASVTPVGSLGFQAPLTTFALPAVGSSSASWDLDSTPQLSALATYPTAQTVVSVDSTAGSWTRHETPQSGIKRNETLYANVPRAGYIHRPAADVIADDGSTEHVNEYFSLKIPGLGLTPLLMTTQSGGKRFELSVVQP